MPPSPPTPLFPHPTPSSLFLASWWLCCSTAIIRLGDAALLQQLYVIYEWLNAGFTKKIRGFVYFILFIFLPVSVTSVKGCATESCPASHPFSICQRSQLVMGSWVGGEPTILNWSTSIFFLACGVTATTAFFLSLSLSLPLSAAVTWGIIHWAAHCHVVPSECQASTFWILFCFLSNCFLHHWHFCGGFWERDVASKALPVKHPRASDSQGFTPKPSAAVRMQEDNCGVSCRSVPFLHCWFWYLYWFSCLPLCYSIQAKPAGVCLSRRAVLFAVSQIYF